MPPRGFLALWGLLKIYFLVIAVTEIDTIALKVIRNSVDNSLFAGSFAKENNLFLEKSSFVT